MKHATLLVLAVALTLTAACLGLTSCSKKQASLPTAPAVETASPQFAFVSFPNGAAPDEALKYASSNNLKIVAFQHTIDIAGDRATAFLPAYPYESASMLRDRWQRAYATFIQSAATTIQQNAPLEDSPSFAASTKTLSRAFSSTSATLTPLNGRFDAMIVAGSKERLAALRSDATTQVEAVSSESGERPASGDFTRRAPEPTSAKSVQQSCFTPSAGKTITQPSPYYSGQREAYNYFGWSSTCWSAGTTFELDFVLNNSCPSSLGCGTYLDAGKDIYGFPRYEYAVTNQPAAYLDSRSGDPGYVVAYTLGCADAIQLVAGKTYYTYWRTRNGAATADNGSINSEYGVRLCGSYNTWCSGWYPTREIIVPSWTLAVPGTRNW